MRRLTFVIPNFNYEDFVGDAIRSALDVHWADVEVIVVDDGSTDGSVEVVQSFGDRVQLIQQRNQGPRVACNVGFAASTGDWVIFLDSDDMVQPEIGRAIDANDRPGLSKLQFQMRRVDRAGLPAGRDLPRYRTVPRPEQIRHWMRTTASYPTPPGSGNAYPRPFLERFFPLDGRCGDATDSALLAAAPFCGDVLTVRNPLLAYRVHGQNRSYLLGDTTRFSKQLERALQRHRLAQELDGQLYDSRWLVPLFRGRHLLQLRVAHHRLSSSPSPIPGDGLLRLLANSVQNVFSPGPEGPPTRLAVAAWCVCTLLAPRRISQALIRQRFEQPGLTRCSRSQERRKSPK